MSNGPLNIAARIIFIRILVLIFGFQKLLSFLDRVFKPPNVELAAFNPLRTKDSQF